MKRLCLICGKQYQQVGRHVLLSHNTSLKEYYDQYINNSPKLCTVCGGQLKFKNIRDGYNKYCSHKCSIVINNPKPKNSIDIKCLVCEKIFQVKNSIKNRAKYCSLKCKYIDFQKRYSGDKNPFYGKGFIGELNPNWQGGKSFEPYNLEFNDKLKRMVRKRDNYTCQECGYTEKQLGYSLSVHHIDYNKNSNILDNLISLCKNCHGQTNWERDDWSKYFISKIRRFV